MKAVQGKCRYCGQYQAIEVPDSYTETDIDDEVTKRCECAEAVTHTKIEENIAIAESQLQNLFKGKEEVTILRDMLHKAIRPLAEGKIGKVSIAKGAYVASMKPTKDGVKISLKYTEEDSVET